MGLPFWNLLTVGLCSAATALGQTTVLYETKFERSEGFDPEKDLAGQRGWVMQGSGGNGLIELIPDLGQQGYIGFQPPTDTNTFTSVWRPVDFDPAPANYPIIKFSVKQQLVRSTEGTEDDFRWSVYNIAGDRLLSIDFETSTSAISYVLEDGNFVSTGFTFDFEGPYDLVIWMDFQRNFWSAYLNDVLIANSQPLTQKNSPLTFGDVDAVWFVRGAPAGNNYMAFDDYRITAEAITSIPPWLESGGVNTNGFYTFLGYGEKTVKYSVDVTTDFIEWFSLGEFVNEEGVFQFEDTTSKDFIRGFYRLREVP